MADLPASVTERLIDIKDSAPTRPAETASAPRVASIPAMHGSREMLVLALRTCVAQINGLNDKYAAVQEEKSDRQRVRSDMLLSASNSELLSMMAAQQIASSRNAGAYFAMSPEARAYYLLSQEPEFLEYAKATALKLNYAAQEARDVYQAIKSQLPQVQNSSATNALTAVTWVQGSLVSKTYSPPEANKAKRVIQHAVDQLGAKAR